MVKVCIRCWQIIPWVSAGTLDNPYHLRCWEEKMQK